MEDVFVRYRDEVRDHIYPGPEHTVYMKEEERQAFEKAVDWSPRSRPSQEGLSADQQAGEVELAIPAAIPETLAG